MRGLLNSLKFALMALALVLLIPSCSKSESGQTQAQSQTYPMFADSNANGINDYYEPATHNAGSYSRGGPAGYGHAYADNNGDGICDWAQDGSAAWHGPGFIDNNGDGICDYWQEFSHMHNSNGGMNFHDSDGNYVNDYVERGWHMGYGHEFTDENGDGICDYAQTGSAQIFHGPGFNDQNGDGVCDAWQSGGSGYGGPMMGGGGPGYMPMM